MRAVAEVDQVLMVLAVVEVRAQVAIEQPVVSQFPVEYLLQ